MRDILFIGSIIVFVAAFIITAYACLVDLGWIKARFHFKLSLSKTCNYIKNTYLGLPKNLRIFLYMVFFLFSSRVILYFISYWGYRIFGGEQISFFAMFEKTWSNLADTPRYLSIAKEGYISDGDFYKMINIAFYPLYPCLIVLASLIFKNYFYSGIFVSYISLVAACCYFYKLLLLDYDEQTSRRTIKYFLIYPFSIFLSAVYTESLFMATILMFFYYARTKKWFLAAVAGFFASMCRNQGVLLIVPMIYEIMIDIKDKMQINKKRANTAKAKRKKHIFQFSYLSTFFIPMGFVIYLLMNKIVTGDFFMFLKYQREYWLHEFGWFPYALLPHYDQIVEYGGPLQIYFNAPQIIMFFAAVFSILFFVKKIRLSYLIYSIIYIFISYGVVGEAGLLSGPRYLIALFPMFISAALVTKYKFLDNLLSYFCILFSVILVIMLTFDRGIV